MVQYQARLAVGKIYEELAWESLSDRIWFRRLSQFFKIQNCFTPEYLFDTSENDHHSIKCRASSFWY